MSYAELEAQRVAGVVDNAEERMILPAERCEIGETAVISIVLDRERPSLG